MNNHQNDQKGATLIEGVIAILILCMVIISLLMITWIIIQGKSKPRDHYDTAFALNSLRDELSVTIQKLDDPDPTSIEETANDFIHENPQYSDWMVANTTLENHLCVFDLIHNMNDQLETYEVELYIPHQEKQ